MRSSMCTWKVMSGKSRMTSLIGKCLMENQERAQECAQVC